MKIGHSESFNQWEGCRPGKFHKGGRKHDNHPLDELDNLLLSQRYAFPRMFGPSKRRFYEKEAMDEDYHFKPHIRANQYRNFSNVDLTDDHLSK